MEAARGGVGDGATALDKLDRHAPLLARAFFAITTLIWSFCLIGHVVRGSRAYFGFFADDFFYYVVIADRFVTTGHLTFDGTHPTNGFHPLWFVVIAALRLVFGAGHAFYVALTVVTAALAMTTFELYARLGQALGVRRSISFGAAAYLAYDVNYLLADGMEVTLAVPMVAALLLALARTDSPTPRRAALLGLLSSLAILSRLDVTILVGMIATGYLVLAADPLAVKARCALAFGAGGLLFPAYLAFNRVSFGILMPTSAVAKQMTTSLGVNPEFLIGRLFELGPKAAIVPLVAFVLVATGKSPGDVAAGPLRGDRRDRVQRRVPHDVRPPVPLAVLPLVRLLAVCSCLHGARGGRRDRRVAYSRDSVELGRGGGGAARHGIHREEERGADRPLRVSVGTAGTTC